MTWHLPVGGLGAAGRGNARGERREAVRHSRNATGLTSGGPAPRNADCWG